LNSGRPRNPKGLDRERRPFESTADIELMREWLFLNVSQVKPKLLKTKPKLLKTSQLESLLSVFSMEIIQDDHLYADRRSRDSIAVERFAWAVG
jgi:hypothetical protein